MVDPWCGCFATFSHAYAVRSIWSSTFITYEYSITLDIRAQQLLAHVHLENHRADVLYRKKNIFFVFSYICIYVYILYTFEYSGQNLYNILLATVFTFKSIPTATMVLPWDPYEFLRLSSCYVLGFDFAFTPISSSGKTVRNLSLVAARMSTHK